MLYRVSVWPSDAAPRYTARGPHGDVHVNAQRPCAQPPKGEQPKCPLADKWVDPRWPSERGAALHRGWALTGFTQRDLESPDLALTPDPDRSQTQRPCDARFHV